MGNRKIGLESKSRSCMFILLLFIIAILPVGCARHGNLVAGQVKEISGKGKVSPMLKPGTAQVSISSEGSPIVEMETVTIPPLKEPPPPVDYVVGPNDRILVTIESTEHSSGSSYSDVQPRGSRVDGSGNIQIPMLGLVKVSGMTLPQIRSLVQKLLKQYMREPSVIVEVTDFGSCPLYILGQFNKAGVFYMDRPFNVLQGIALAGGYVSGSANPRSARIIRDNRILPVDVYELLMNADQTQNIWLKPGDTIFMPDNKNQTVFVFGAGKTGMQIQVPPSGLNILQAIAMAGLQEIGYHSQNVHLIRSLSPTRGQLMVIDVDAILEGNARPLDLSEGDIIYIPKSGLTSWNEAISEILPTLQAFGAILTPFVQVKYLFDNND